MVGLAPPHGRQARQWGMGCMDTHNAQYQLMMDRGGCSLDVYFSLVMYSF